MDFLPLDVIPDPRPDWLDGVELRADRWRNEDTRAIKVIDNGDLVAVGLLWTSRVHPTDRYWAEAHVAPHRRREGIGTAVVSHLTGLRHQSIPLMHRGYVGDDLLHFADALGARTVQVVPPSIVDVAARTALRPHPSVVGADQVSWDALKRANATIYEWTHAEWSPVGPGFAEALDRILESGLDRQAASVALSSDGRIRALANAYTDRDDAEATVESVDPRDPLAERLVEGCVRRTLDVLAERGVDTVDFDGHVTDPHFMPVLARLNPRGRWFRLVELVVDAETEGQAGLVPHLGEEERTTDRGALAQEQSLAWANGGFYP